MPAKHPGEFTRFLPEIRRSALLTELERGVWRNGLCTRSCTARRILALFDKSITMKATPGFPHKDISWLFGLIAVRAPISDVRKVAGEQTKGTRLDSHAFELDGGGYTLLSWDKCEPELAKWLSNRLMTTVAYLWDEDTSGWFGYSVFKEGAELEVFQFGANYEDELQEFAEELGDDMPTQDKRKEGWDAFVSHDGEDIQFRSTLTKATDEELLKGLKFVDARFKAIGIPVPRDFPKDQEVISFTRQP